MFLARDISFCDDLQPSYALFRQMYALHTICWLLNWGVSISPLAVGVWGYAPIDIGSICKYLWCKMGCPVSFPHCQWVVPAFHPRSNGPASNLVKLQLIVAHLKVIYLPLVLWFLLLSSPTPGKQFWYSTCVTKWHTFFSHHGSVLARSRLVSCSASVQ